MYREHGFTLIEIITTLILIGILAVIIIPKSQNQNIDALVAEDVIKFAIRQCQMRAMSDLPSASWRIDVAPSGSNSTVTCSRTESGTSNTISTQTLEKFNDSFNVTFTQLGQTTYSKTVSYLGSKDDETGYIP